MITFFKTLLIASSLIATIAANPVKSDRGIHGKPIPPDPILKGAFDKDYNQHEVANRVESWKPEDGENVWELSGLLEGDIMIYSDDDKIKNGLLSEKKRWKDAIVPYYIKEDGFGEDDIQAIKNALKEYHERTCIRFRPYKEGDTDYVVVQATPSGCWSSVGRTGKGQTLNLQNPGCVRHGTIVHEFLHALGFYHQQSAYNRDEYVTIHWDNIQEGKEHNFNKYEANVVTDYGIPYDYNSVMHYSAKAFSKNGEPTITKKKDFGGTIGQRVGMSESDVAKLEAMYKEICANRDANTEESDEDSDWSLD